MATEPISNSDFLVENLRSAILGGRFEPGAPLRQDELARHFGVSHIPIREALRRLEAEGLVAIRPRRGAIVADLSAREIQELNEMRVSLECLALCLAIPRITKEELLKANNVLDCIDEEPARWGALNTQFHTVIYAPAQRPRLLATIVSLLRNTERYLHHEIEVLNNLDESQRQHRRLLKLIRSQRTDDACALLTKHIEEPDRLLVSRLRAQGLE